MYITETNKSNLISSICDYLVKIELSKMGVKEIFNYKSLNFLFLTL